MAGWGSACGGILRCAGGKRKRGRVDAIPQAGRLRPVLKNMPEVCAALSAAHFNPNHAMAVVRQRFDHLVIHRLPIAGPAAARVEFRFGLEQPCAAAHAVVVPAYPVIPKPSGEGALCGGPAGHLELDVA